MPCTYAGDLKSKEGIALVDKYHVEFVNGLRAIWERYKEDFAAHRRRSLNIVQ